MKSINHKQTGKLPTQHKWMVDGSSNAIGQDEDPEPGQLSHHEEGY